MHAKQKGFTLIEILVVVTIIGVLAGLVVVLIPRGQREQVKIQCTNNVRGITNLLTVAKSGALPPHGGADLILYLVMKNEISAKDEDALKTLFCPGDQNESFEKAGGKEIYSKLDLNRPGVSGHLTSYAGRDQLRTGCAAKLGGDAVVLVCDDSDDHHFKLGFVVGLSNGATKFRDKVDDWKISVDTEVSVGEGSDVPELTCLKAD